MKGYLFKILIIFMISMAALADTQFTCLNYKADNICVECMGTYFLQAGACYRKLRGCLVHRIISQQSKQEVICGQCQNGYVKIKKLCERQAVAQLRLGQLKNKRNQPATIRIYGQKLKQNITIQSSGTQKPTNLQNYKIFPVFPEIQITKNISLQNVNKNYQKIQLDPKIQQLIAVQFPTLANLQPLYWSNKIDNDSYIQIADKFLVYEQGSIIMVTKSKQAQLNNIRKIAQSNSNSEYSLIFLGNSKQMYRQLFALKAQVLQSKFAEIVSVSLSLNFQLKTQNTKNNAIFNIEIPNGSIRSINNIKKQEEQIIYKIQDFAKNKKQYQEYFRYAYTQYVNNISILNLPNKIIGVKAQKNQETMGILFKITYQVQNQLEKQYALIQYKIPKNQTKVLGYFIDGMNVLNYFNNIGNQANQTNPQASINKTEQNKVSNLAKNNTNSSQIKVEETKQKKSQFAYTSISNKQRQNTSAIQNNTISANSSIKNSTKQSEIKVNEVVKINETQKNSLNNSNLIPSKIQNSVVPSKPLQQNVSQILNQMYKKFNIIENPIKNINTNETKQVKNSVNKQKNQTNQQNQTKVLPKINITGYIKTLQKIENCHDAVNSSIVPKLDIALKKSYPFLSSYLKNASLYKNDEAGQKYWLVYSNQQMKMVFYELYQNRNTRKFVISKSGVLHSGFNYERKEMETMNLKIVDFEEQNCQKNANFTKYLQCALTELVKIYKPYMTNGVILSALTNSTHIKLFISTKFATFEFIKKLDDSLAKGVLNLIEKKLGYDIWPIGNKKQILKTTQIENYKKLEIALLRRYRIYFPGGTGQIFVKRNTDQQYQIVFKSLFGFFSLKSTLQGDSANFGPLEKTFEFQQPKIIPQCTNNQFLQTLDKKCFKKIVGCYKQIGNICILCNVGLSLHSQMKQCSISCLY